MTRVSVVGLGYIGLPTAILASQAGCNVFGYDTNHDKIKRINSGDPSIFEPELSERLWKALKNGSFKAFTDLQYADYFIIAVPTPYYEKKNADLSAVFNAAQMIAKYLMPGNVVILESTVPVGTTQKIAIFLEEQSGLKLGIDFFVAYCPERVLPGKIFKELVENDRIIGGVCHRSCKLAHQLYSKLVKGFIHITDEKTAEMVKLIENASRDVSIAFANQVEAMCQKAGIDAFHTIELANKHPRVKILTPTCGVGGHCIAVDPWFLIQGFPEDTKLLQVARSINENKPYTIINYVFDSIDTFRMNKIEKAKILILGLTFKPDVDDMRQSPALFIAQQLNTKLDILELKIYDHNAPREEVLQNNFGTASDIWQGIDWADIIIVLVKHKEFSLIRQEAFNNKIVIDTCGLLHDMHTKQSQAFFDGVIRTSIDFKSKTL